MPKTQVPFYSIYSIALVLLFLLMSGCEKNAETAPEPPLSSQTQPTEEQEVLSLSEASKALLDIQSERAERFCQSTADFFKASSTFLASPNKETLSANRDAWLTIHQAYLPLKLWQYFPLEIPMLDAVEVQVTQADSSVKAIEQSMWQRIDQTPLLGGYLDYVEHYPLSGLVNSEVELDQKMLEREFQFADDYYVTLGFHALEFMLWGELGSRPLEDFTQPGKSPEKVSRRLQLIGLIAEQLKQDTSTLCAQLTEQKNLLANSLNRYPDTQQLEIWLQAIQSLLEKEVLSSLSPTVQQHSAFSGSGFDDLRIIAYHIKVLVSAPSFSETLKEEASDLTPALLHALEDTVNLLTHLSGQKKTEPPSQSEITAVSEATSKMIDALQTIVNHL